MEYIQKIHTRLVFKYLVLEPKALTRSCPFTAWRLCKMWKAHLKPRSRTDFGCPESNRNQWSNDSEICLWTAHDHGEFTPRPEQQQHDHQRCHAHPNPPNREKKSSEITAYGACEAKSKNHHILNFHHFFSSLGQIQMTALHLSHRI